MGQKVNLKPARPLYTHNCLNCVFLGTFDKTGKKQSYFFDLYVCNLEGVTNFVARYGNNEHEIFKKNIESDKIPEVIKNLLKG